MIVVIIGLIALVVLAVWIARPIKNQFGTFGDDDYDYEGEARARGWIE
jgi:hypothetical protein